MKTGSFHAVSVLGVTECMPSFLEPLSVRLHMALDRSEGGSIFTSDWAWRGGAVAGFVATVATGIVIMITSQGVLQEAIAGMYGQRGSLIIGWVAHLVHGTLLGTLFSLLLADPGLYRLTDWWWKTLLAGVVFGLVLAITGAGIILPIWLEVLGYPSPPSFPFVTTGVLLWHLVYGVVLGTVFPFIEHI